MKGIVVAAVVLFISLVFGQFIDKSIDDTSKTSSLPMQTILSVVKIILGFPGDIIEIILKIIVLIFIVIGGEAV